MRWRNRLIAVAWAVFAVWSVAWLQPRWIVDTPLRQGSAFLPIARLYFIPDERNDDPDTYFDQAFSDQVDHYLWSSDHVDALERAPGVQRVVVTEPEPVPFPAKQLVDHIVVDGITIERDDDTDPIKGPILARVLNDAAEIEWRMLWKRTLIGTAVWATALVAMLGLTRWTKRRAAQSCQTAEQG